MRALPFPMAEDNASLCGNIMEFDEGYYKSLLDVLFSATGLKEDGKGANRVADFIISLSLKKGRESIYETI